MNMLVGMAYQLHILSARGLQMLTLFLLKQPLKVIVIPVFQVR